MNISDLHRRVSVTPLFDTEYLAVLNLAQSQSINLPSKLVQEKQNQLIIDLKSNGIWERLDTFAVFANDIGLNFGLIDWKRISLYTSVNSNIFVNNKGVKGNGIDSFVNSNYNPVTNAVNISQNSNSYGAFVFEGDTITSNVKKLWANATNSQLNSLWRRGGSTIHVHNGISNVIIAPTKTFLTDKFYHNDRINGTTVHDIIDGVDQFTANITSDGILSQQFSLFNPAQAGGTVFLNAGVSLVWAGSSLYDKKVIFYNIVKNYLDSL